MTQENKDILLNLLDRHRELGIASQIDYDKFYLYSIIVHSTAIEGSTVTEVEAQLLFDEGITNHHRLAHHSCVKGDGSNRQRIQCHGGQFFSCQGRTAEVKCNSWTWRQVIYVISQSA